MHYDCSHSFFYDIAVHQTSFLECLPIFTANEKTVRAYAELCAKEAAEVYEADHGRTVPAEVIAYGTGSLINRAWREIEDALEKLDAERLEDEARTYRPEYATYYNAT